MTKTLRYRYRLRPGKHAEIALLAEWDRCRWLWNQCVVAGKRQKKYPGERFINGADLTVARARLPWLAEGSAAAQQNVLRAYSTKKAKNQGVRKMKKKTAKPSLGYARNGFYIKDGHLKLIKIASIPVVWHRELPSQPTSVRVYRDNLGHWYASFVVQVEDKPSTLVLPTAVGIDWGVKEIATSSTGTEFDLPHPEFAKKAAANVKKYQRQMARRQLPKGKAQTRGYRAAKLRTARAQKKVARQRQDTARKWVRKIVDSHTHVAVEDFKPTFLFSTRMARKSADASIGTAKRELISSANRSGRTVALVHPAYTTQTCSACGLRTKDRLTLRDRIFVCTNTECGHIQQRDRNAARTILAQAGFDLASADDISRLAPPRGGELVAV